MCFLGSWVFRETRLPSCFRAVPFREGFGEGDANLPVPQAFGCCLSRKLPPQLREPNEIQHL